jgi:hypothetical protein
MSVAAVDTIAGSDGGCFAVGRRNPIYHAA